MMSQLEFQDILGQNIYLTFSPQLFSNEPDHVLIVAVYQGKLLFTCHSKRGWELPGGKIEPGETPEEAAVREAWEETGAVIKDVEKIGEYRVSVRENTPFIKAIYLAKVESIGELPQGFETIQAALFPIHVNPHQAAFSPFMKDQVFANIQKRLGTLLSASS